MKLKTLLSRLPETVLLQLKIYGSREVAIKGVCSDSRLAAPGNIFIARKGLKFDGASFISDAVMAGATVIVTDLYDPTLKLTQIVHSDPASITGDLAAAFYGFPSQALTCIGVTGTSGKTSTTLMIRSLLNSLGIPCGLIGTIETIVGDRHQMASRTTPDVVTLQHLLADMVEQGDRAVAMEVTSHGLTQGRTQHIAFDVGVFTNLTQDHLDYHGTMESYAQAKAKLFDQAATAVVNGDDPWTPTLLKRFQGVPLTFGLSPQNDLRASQARLSLEGTHFTLNYQGQTHAAFIPLVGMFNLYNALAAIGAVLATGFSLDALLPHLSSLPQARGRFEFVPNEQGLSICVDYAHKPHALENALTYLKQVCSGRLIALFGCGGDRDRMKRPIMGAIAAKLASHSIITNDNPRSEDPASIAQQIVSGMEGASYEVILDRRLAIATALQQMEPGDVLLIAGKGHETTQEFAHKTLRFDDRAVVTELLNPISACV